MYSPDVVSLRQFYSTPMGMAAHMLIDSALKSLWPHVKDETLLGIGYCLPYFESYVQEAIPAMVCMPAYQGAAYWPHGRDNLVFLGHESELPLPENSVNRILLLHSVENSEQLSGMIDEIWRVLTPGGRVLAIVPNRRGFWASSSRSPFGYGRPFSMAQLRDLLSTHHFTLARSSSALFIPPTRLRFLWRIAKHIEMAGKFLCPFFGGVLLIEAEKQIYAAIRQPVVVRKGYRLAIPAANPALGMRHKAMRCEEGM